MTELIENNANTDYHKSKTDVYPIKKHLYDSDEDVLSSTTSTTLKNEENVTQNPSFEANNVDFPLGVTKNIKDDIIKDLNIFDTGIDESGYISETSEDLNDLNNIHNKNHYKIVQNLSYEETQKYFCHMLDRLKGQLKQVTSKLHNIQDKQQQIHLYPLQSSSSSFIKKTSISRYRFLAWNFSGSISLTSTQDHKHGSSDSSTKDNTIEIISNVSGVGQRRRTVNNLTKCFNLAAIGPDGFALVRGEKSQTLVSQYFTTIEDTSQSINVNKDTSHDSTFEEQNHCMDSDSDEDINNKESFIEYHSFSTWGLMSKSWWSKSLEYPEVIQGVAVGEGFIAMITSKNYLRILSPTGMNRQIIRLNGTPFSISARGSCLLCVTYTQNGSTASNIFHFRIFHIAKMIELTRSDLSMRSTGSLVWVGFTPRFIPIAVDSMGEVFGLLPSFQYSCSTTGTSYTTSTASFITDWIPLLDLKETLPQHQAASICTDSSPRITISDFLWIGGSTDNEIQVYRLSRRHPQPPVMSNLTLLDCPFRLPYARTLNERFLKYMDWVNQISADPDFKDMSRVSLLSWDIFDELRGRLQLMKSQLDMCLLYDQQEDNNDKIKEIEKAKQKLSVFMDKTLFRIFMKAVSDSRVELALEAAQQFTHPKTFRVALQQAETRGMKSLCDRLNSEIECRIIKENSLSTRQQLHKFAPEQNHIPKQFVVSTLTSSRGADNSKQSITELLRQEMNLQDHISSSFDERKKREDHFLDNHDTAVKKIKNV